VKGKKKLLDGKDGLRGEEGTENGGGGEKKLASSAEYQRSQLGLKPTLSEGLAWIGGK